MVEILVENKTENWNENSTVRIKIENYAGKCAEKL